MSKLLMMIQLVREKKNVDNQWPQLIVKKVFLNYGNTGGVLKVMQYT